MSDFMRIVMNGCCLFGGVILMYGALFGTVSSPWLPDTAAHVLMAFVAACIIAKGSGA